VREPSGLYYPNRLARYFLLAMEDVMGKSGLAMVMNLAGFDSGELPPDTLTREFDFAAIAALNLALEDMYGARGGRGLALRIGRSCFAQGMKTFGALAGASDSAFRALPMESRCRLGLTALADIFTNFSDQTSRFSENDRSYLFVVDNSPMAWGRSTDKPVCHALVGILQEGLRWVSNGHEFHVTETECRAAGNETCVFTVNKKPIGQS
jgi:predicted hydrocarbon binding protein